MFCAACLFHLVLQSKIFSADAAQKHQIAFVSVGADGEIEQAYNDNAQDDGKSSDSDLDEDALMQMDMDNFLKHHRTSMGI